MNTFNLTEIDDDALFTKDVVLDETFLLTCVSVPVTAKLKQALVEWEFRQVLSEGDLTQQVVAAASNESDSSAPAEEVTDDFQQDMEDQNAPDISGVNIMQRAMSIVENNDSGEKASIEDNKLFLVQTVYNEYLNISKIFIHFL